MARSIQYELDKVYTIKMDMDACERYEDATGKLFLETDLAKLTIKQMLTIIWAGMNNELTLDEVKKLVNEYSDIASLYEKAVDAALSTFPEPKEGKPGDAERVNKAGKNVRRA